MTRRLFGLATAAALILAAALGIPGLLLPSLKALPDQSDARHARRLLDQVPTQGRAPITGYSRDSFGSGWATVRGCDTRNRVLARDLTNIRYRPGTHHCVVTAGTLHDPYTGRTITFTKGDRTSTLVQIDHRYPLALAWQQGAQKWTADRREQFANDPANLQAVEGHVNEAKGASGPGSWLPPNKNHRCRYVITFVEVAAHWQLSINPSDRRAAAAVLDRCG